MYTFVCNMYMYIAVYKKRDRDKLHFKTQCHFYIVHYAHDQKLV